MRRQVTMWSALVVLAAVRSASGQAPGLDSVTVVPGAHYAKGGIYRFFFGDHYRDLWTTPIKVPVLNLKTFAGGLTPTKKGGGQQTKTLRFSGADGKEYAFRSIDKDPSIVLPQDLRETFADRLFQDQISSGHPAGALVVPEILDAAGVLHSKPFLVVMPDDPALGSYRAEFAKVLGTLEERPKDADDEGMSFAGAKEIVGTADLIKAVDRHPHVRVDSREFLLARLTDVFLGDWDRHDDQWRWAKLETDGVERWVPIPRDRDQAFVRFDGLVLGTIRPRVPQLVNFGPKYSAIIGATWNGRDLDRRFLTDLELPVWDSLAKVLQSRLTNDVIDRAVGGLPAEFRRIDGPRMTQALRARRDKIPEMARNYYHHLSREVDVFASDQPDLAIAKRDDKGVDVTVARMSQPDRPYYHRRFFDGDTKDIRIYLEGGADSAVVQGDGSGIKVRFVGGGGPDRYVKDGDGSAKVYDSKGENQATGLSINTKAYQPIDDTTKVGALPHRDWGKNKIRYPLAALAPDAGFEIGWAGRFTHFGFRKKPYSSYLRYSALVATGASTGKVDVYARTQRENSSRFLAIDVLASGIEVLRWYGFGNNRTVDDSKGLEFNRVTQHQVALEPSLGWSFGNSVQLSLGPRFKYSVTELDDGKNQDRFISIDRPFGTGNFTQLGAGANLTIDTRDVPAAPRRGVRLELGGGYYPSILDVEKPFGEVHAQASTYLAANIPTEPVLALQVGGKKVFGTAGKIPFHEAAFLGSGETLRGYRSHRFAGDASVYGSAELRLHLTNLFIFVPGRQGVFGFYDRGRVYLEGENSDTWYHSWGAGVWMAFVTRGSLVSAGIGHSDERNRIFARFGFAF